MHEALLYQKLKDKKMKCEVCHHGCTIASGRRGICGVRENQNGILYALNYGKIIAAHIDPIEKKPLYHFLPNTLTYSIATVGCNFRCLNCQNADISQQQIANNNKQLLGEYIEPEKIVQNAIKNNCPSISYTYTEPTIFLECALDTMKLAKDEKFISTIRPHSYDSQTLKNIWVSNGYMSQKTLELIVPYLDAINVDLKSFSKEFYKKICKARLEPVLDNLIKIKKAGIHLEITTLIIPTLNDSREELWQIANFIFQKLSPNTPWHVSAFYPTYKMTNLPATPKEKIYEAVEIGKKVGLKFVHAGNVQNGIVFVIPSARDPGESLMTFYNEINKLKVGSTLLGGTVMIKINFTRNLAPPKREEPTEIRTPWKYLV